MLHQPIQFPGRSDPEGALADRVGRTSATLTSQQVADLMLDVHRQQRAFERTGNWVAAYCCEREQVKLARLLP